MKPDQPERAIIAAHIALLLVVLLASLAWSSSAHCAQPEPLCTEEWRQDAGRVAPCSGVLAPTRTFADLLGAQARAAACLDDKARAAELCEADKTLLRTKLRDTEAARAACEAAHVPPSPPKPETHWYSSPEFTLGLGVVLGVAATIGVVEAVR